MSSGAAFALLFMLGFCSSEAAYFGKDLGVLSELHHGVKGRVYAVDSRTLYLKDFHYDGEGPAAYFYVGSSKAPHATGAVRLRDERGATNPLRRYRGESVTLSLPEGTSLKDVKWFSVWCDEFSVNFGDVKIPRELDYPKPAKIGALSGVHGVSSDPIVVVDAQTLLVPNFSYDGEAPDAKFWVGRGEKPSPQGIRIPDENGKENPLRRYDRKTIVLTLPGELTIFDIGHFSVWCEAFTVNFGHVTLPRSKISNVPPSLKMLGVSPQSKLNCEVLHDELAFEVRWAVAGDSIVLQLVAKLEDGEYLSFGLSGDNAHSQMVGGDVAVAWVDKSTLKGYAHDYYLDAKSQCAGVRGSCPDDRLGEKTNSLRLLNAALVNGYSIVTYQRSLKASDELDRPIFTNISQPIIWAIGPLNSRNEVSYHSHFLKGDKFIEFGRPPVWNCPMPESEEEQHHKESSTSQSNNRTGQPEVSLVAVAGNGLYDSAVIKPNPVPTPKPVPRVEPWEIPPIQCHEPADGVFYAQMGPTGGKQGYSAITGHVGWGISWYINGLLIPEINVVRGKKYTFVVEGGSNSDVPARYHPFYITNDPVGGYFHKSDTERQNIEIYAGVRRSRTGELVPTGVGRLCNWTPDNEGPEADEYPSFGAYQRSLTLVCEEGNPGVITWIPDKNTPDTVYYQCFTHRHLGWKINVLDECDVIEGGGSQFVERLAPPNGDLLEGEESIQVATRVKPDTNFILNQRKKYEKIINTKNNYNDFSKVQDDFRKPGNEVMSNQEQSQNHFNTNLPEFELPIANTQLEEAIKAAESLENKQKDDFVKDIRLPPSVIFKDGVNKDPFLPERPIGEDDDYFLEPVKMPTKYILPPNQKPLTLQSVMRPHGTTNGPMGQMRPPFRRPTPPEMIRRPPPPQHLKVNGYPLSMPNPQGQRPVGPPPNMKKYSKYPPNNGRLPPNMNRPPQPPQPQPPKLFQKGGNPQNQHGNNLQHQMTTHGNNLQYQMPMHGTNNLAPQLQHLPPKPIQKISSHGSVQSIILGKPINPSLPPQSQTLSLGKTDIIANQVVKSQITLPGFNEPTAQHSSPQTYFSKPGAGQIILGIPMEHPFPLDQQMTPTKQYPVRASSTPQIEVVSNKEQSQSDIKSSDFIGESTDASTFTPAVNTGFKPDTVVIESGFKPIIREPLMASEDTRVADLISENFNRREDTNVELEYENDDVQYINTNQNYPEKQTETFEPMFIPSPEDHMLPTNDRTKEVFPSNHAKENRPHPVYVKTESELNDLFSKKNMEKEVPTDMVMESNKVSPQYLPPDPKLPKEHSQKVVAEETYTTYDGKTVSAVSLTAVPVAQIAKTTINTTKLFSAKLPKNTEQLLRTPQFRPFKGDIPPLSLDAINVGTPAVEEPINKNTRSTSLKIVNSFIEGEPLDIELLKTEDSKKMEYTDEFKEPEPLDIELLKPEDSKKMEFTDESTDESVEYEEQNEEENDEEEESSERKKREAKDAQFETENSNSFPKQKEFSGKNQIDFERHSSEGNKSSSTKLEFSMLSTVLLLVCLKFL